MTYQLLDDAAFPALLANAPERNAEYVFLLSEPTPLGETQWGYAEETRIHRRMFQPYNLLASEAPVPPGLWLRSISVHLTQLTAFQERPDLYSANHGADGKLDRAIWRAVDARYSTDVLFDTQADPDYRVTGEARFVVIEDLTKQAGDSGKFLLYLWEDLVSATKPDPSPPSSATWGMVKYLYH